jgi:hypothetical protein
MDKQDYIDTLQVKLGEMTERCLTAETYREWFGNLCKEWELVKDLVSYNDPRYYDLLHQWLHDSNLEDIPELDVMLIYRKKMDELSKEKM